MKLTKTKKNQHPKLYGYGTLEQLQSDPDNTQTHWILYKDADGDYRFIPCDEAYYHAYRNEERNERRVRDLESRCLIPSEKYGLVKCRADCSLCPKVRDGLPISIDYMYDNYEFEFADGSYEAELEKEAEQHQADLIWSLVDELEPTDQQIIKLFNEGKTDAAIAGIIKKSRSLVQLRRKQLIEELKEKIKKFE
jgi:hypothetical protein